MKAIPQIIIFSFLLLAWMPSAAGQTEPLSERMASSVMTFWKDSTLIDPGKTGTAAINTT